MGRVDATYLPGDSLGNCGSANSTYLPVVFFPGMGNLCTLKRYTDRMTEIKQTYPGICTFCLGFSDQTSSVQMDVWQQLFAYNKGVQRHVPKQFDTINLIGYSLGALLARAYVQAHNRPKVHNLISINGPQAGTGGCPKDPVGRNLILKLYPFMEAMCDSAVKLIDFYDTEHCAFCQFWKDANSGKEVYLQKSTFLAQINNDKPHAYFKQYQDNMKALNSL